MPFTVETLSLSGFRSYKDAYLSFDPALTILHGPNAAGKTNIIEALQMLTVGESFRKPHRQDLINWEYSQASAIMRAIDENLQRDVSLTITEKSKTTTVNEKRIQSAFELSSALPCVVFNPDDLRIVKESSATRRKELDGLGSQLSATYARLVSEYKKIVSQRNKMLKDNQYGSPAFNAWTDRMIEVGLALAEKRISLLEHLEPQVIRFYLGLLGQDGDTDSDLTMCYASSWGQEKNETSFRGVLVQRKEDEIARRQSLVGPHRDDIIFEINGKLARNFASQGQQRSIALAWKLAQLVVIEDLCQTRPLLLLDDVMSELDQQRRLFLANMVGETTQTIITTAHIDYFEKDLVERAKVILIPEGVIPKKAMQ